MLEFPSRWQCNVNLYSSSQMWLPDFMIDLVGCDPVTTLETARQISLITDGVAWTHGCSLRTWPRDYFGHSPIDFWLDKEKSHVWLLRFNISIKVPYPNRKPLTVTIRPPSQSDYKKPIKKTIESTEFQLNLSISCEILIFNLIVMWKFQNVPWILCLK